MAPPGHRTRSLPDRNIDPLPHPGIRVDIRILAHPNPRRLRCCCWCLIALWSATAATETSSATANGHDGTVAMDASSHNFISHPRWQPLLADRSPPSRCRAGPARIWLRANDSSCDRDGFLLILRARVCVDPNAFLCVTDRTRARRVGSDCCPAGPAFITDRYWAVPPVLQ
jgi:hypothetical protein